MDLGRHLGILDAAQLEEPPRRPARRGVGNRLVDDQVGLAAGQGVAAGAAGDPRLVFHVAQVHRLQVAEHLVDGAVGKQQDVVRMARGLASAGTCR